LDGVTRTTSQINSARDGTVTEVSTGQGLTGTVTSSGSVSMKNSWMSTSSAVFSISGTSFTNSRSYPVFISGRSNAGGGSFTFSVNNGSGGTGTIDMRDGDSGTHDPFAFILPVGGSISGSSFTGVGIELRPG